MNKKVVLSLVVSVFLLTVVYALSFSDLTQGDFNSGSYVNTTHNGTAVVLSGNNLTGNFTSRVFDAGGVARWDNLSSFFVLQNQSTLTIVDGSGAVYQSIDYGISWVQKNNSYGRTSDTYDMFSDSKKNLYILTKTNHEVWKSVDNGVTWDVVNSTFSANNLYSGTFDSQGNIYVSAGSTTGKIFKSADNGVTWTNIANVSLGASATTKGMASNSTNGLFLVSGGGYVYSSINSGATWNLLNSSYGRTSDAVHMFSDELNNLYIVTNSNKEVWKSVDNGITWGVVNSTFSPNYLLMGQSDSAGNIYAISTLDKVYKSSNQGVTWTLSSDFNGASTNDAKGITHFLGLTNLSFQARNCSTSNCAYGIWQTVDLNNVNLTGRYFQYNADFSTQEAGLTPELFNVSIGYVILDNIPPTITINSPLNQTYTNSTLLVNISASDNSAVSQIWFYNGSVNVSYASFDYYTFNQGSNTIIAYANDSFNNINSTNVSFYVDSIAPNIILMKPESKVYGVNSSLPLNFSVSDSGVGVNSCWYNLNNTNNVTLAGCQNSTFNVSSDGDYVLNLFSNDSLGNTASKNVTFSVLTTAPALNLVFPADSSYLNYLNNIYFNYSVSSVIGISSCQLFGNFSGIWSLNQTNSAITQENNYFVLNLSEGNYLWGIFCNDSQNRNSSVNRTFTLDVISPQISVISPIGIVSTNNVTFNFNFTDINSLNYCSYNVTTSGGGGVVTDNPIDCNSPLEYQTISDGVGYILNVFANDSAGNLHSSSSSFSVSTLPSSSSSSGGGGGGGSSGGGSIFVAKKPNIQSDSISSLVVSEAGVKKILTWKVRNNGSSYLNGCIFKGLGAYSSWISHTEIKGLATGEEYTFVFDVNVPEDAKEGKYSLGVSLTCVEVNASSDFFVDIMGKQVDFKLSNVDRISKESVNVKYSLQDLSGKDQNILLQFLLFDLDNKKVSEINESRFLPANSNKEFETTIPIRADLQGELSLLVNLNSETYSSFVQENIVLGKSVSGFTIFGDAGSRDLTVSVMIIVLFLVFAFFIVRRIRTHHKVIKVRNYWKNRYS